MKQEMAEFKAHRRAPAKELHEHKGGKAKKSSKKPWRFDNSWRDDAKFEKVTWPDGLNGKQVKIIKTYKQIQEEKSDKLDLDYGFAMANWKPQPSGNYKTKKSALQAWENFKNKSSGFGSFVYSPDAVDYKLINIETGEEIKL